MNNAIFTHDEAGRIIEFFEDILERYGIVVPSPEDDERGVDNLATLYGSVYGELMDRIEEVLIDLVARAKDSPVITYEYSGT